jgi:exopolysaccharide production protein ExoZ
VKDLPLHVAETRIAAPSVALKSLETLRIVAAALVVCAHLPEFDVPVLKWFFGPRLFIGSIGVDLFFVISGIVIGLSVQRMIAARDEASSFRSFVVARIFRIFPLYLFATALTLALAVVRGHPLPSPGSLLSSILLLPQREDGQFVDPVMHIGWTLRFELYFYVVCALGILFRRRWLPLALVGVGVLLPASVLPYYSNPIILEFIGGYLLAFLVESGHFPRPRPIASWAVFGVALAWMAAAATGHDWGYPPQFDIDQAPRMVIEYNGIHVARWIAWGLPAVLMVTACLMLEGHLRWPIAWAGRYTYSLYLLHPFLLSMLAPLGHRLPFAPSLALIPFICSAAIVCWLAHRFLERPALRWGKSLIRTRAVAVEQSAG